MALGVLQFLMTRRHLGGAGAYRPPDTATPSAAAGARRNWLQLAAALAVAASLLACVVLGWIPINPADLARIVTYAIVLMAVLYYMYYFLFADLSAEERKRGVVLVVLFVGCALFFSGFEQAGSSLNLFAERYTDRMIGLFNFVIPDRLVPVAELHVHLLCAPFFAWMWIALARRN